MFDEATEYEVHPAAAAVPVLAGAPAAAFLMAPAVGPAPVVRAPIKDESSHRLTPIDAPRTYRFHLPRRRRPHYNYDNLYRIAPKATAFSTMEENIRYDYYHIGINIRITPDPRFSYKSWIRKHHPVLLSCCKVSIWPAYFKPGHVNPKALKHHNIDIDFRKYGPHPKTGKTTYSNSIDFGLEGNVGSNGTQFSGANVSASFHMVDSQQREVEDISVLPTIGLKNVLNGVFI
ncbi:MAG: hypothetical protein IBJ00_01770 [Alphaproteobacteria bacterium]|nr:hypothetical protein [Alphaproteobacteria bacterium]